MHAVFLAELAVDLASLVPATRRCPAVLTRPAFHEYWSVSKIRLDRWVRLLQSPAEASVGAAERLQAIGEDILLSELLTRTLVGWLRAVRHWHPSDQLVEWEPVARGVMLGQQQAQNRLLKRLMQSGPLESCLAHQLNTTRRRCERWTDLVLSTLVSQARLPVQQTLDLCCSPRQVVDLAVPEDARRSGVVGMMVKAAIRSHYARRSAGAVPCPDLNERLAKAVLRFLGTWDREIVERLPGLWQARMLAEADDIAGWLEVYDEPASWSDVAAIDGGAVG